MEGLVDLHLHTTCSDGIYSPSEVVEQALAAGLKAIAVTDHDNLDGYLQTARYLEEKNYRVRFLPGVEMNTDYQGNTVHVLGYYINADCDELLSKLAWMRSTRERRIERMTARINELGYAITLAEIQKEADKATSIGRPHVARAMVKKGFFPTQEDVFRTLIAKGKPAYVAQEKITPMEAAALIKRAGGIAFLAHPSEVGNHEVVQYCLEAGKFPGIEVWHPSALAEKETEFWKNLAKEKHLLVSGGSDFHGNADRWPVKLGDFRVKYDDVSELINYR